MRLTIYVAMLASLYCEISSAQGFAANITPQQKKLIFKELGQRKRASIQFIEEKKLRMEFEGSGLKKGSYTVMISEKCPKLGSYSGAKLAKLGQPLFSFETEFGEISHESSTLDHSLKVDGKNSLLQKAVILVLSGRLKSQVIACEILQIE